MQNFQRVTRLEDGEEGYVVRADVAWLQYKHCYARREGDDVRFFGDRAGMIHDYFAESSTDKGANADGAVNEWFAFVVVRRELVEDAKRCVYIRDYLAAPRGDSGTGYLAINRLAGVPGLTFNEAVDKKRRITEAVDRKRADERAAEVPKTSEEPRIQEPPNPST